tara:strand:+ start:138 stop:1208 length:1071 start_codon:yes stop_codon:yes gene_type:complete
MLINNKDTIGDFCLPSINLEEDIDYYEKNLKFKLVEIYPAESPEVAILSGHGMRIRLETNTSLNPGRIRIAKKNISNLNKSKKTFLASNGTEIEIVQESTNHSLLFSNEEMQVNNFDEDNWLNGRAGMLYRNLINEKTKVNFIASHIKIPKGGPVNDKVHYHEINFQIIFCFNGWAKVVYENQGDPITLSKFDCILQPPKIRHKVLESSDNLEVLELTVPGRHSTKIDNKMILPNNIIDKEKLFSNMKFCYFNYKNSQIEKSDTSNILCRNTNIDIATNYKASVEILESQSIARYQINNKNKIFFIFVLDGKITINENQNQSYILKKNHSLFSQKNSQLKLMLQSENTKLLKVEIK